MANLTQGVYQTLPDRGVVPVQACPPAQKTEWSCNTDTGDDSDNKNEELNKEAAQNGDIVMVDMVDTYANVSHIQCTVSNAALLRHRYRALPKKLRLFYRYLAEQVEYDYVLKIDDDTYTNIERYAYVYTTCMRHIRPRTL